MKRYGFIAISATIVLVVFAFRGCSPSDKPTNGRVTEFSDRAVVLRSVDRGEREPTPLPAAAPDPNSQRITIATKTYVVQRGDALIKVCNIQGASRPSFANAQCPPVTVYPARRKSSATSFSISAAASNGIGFRCA